VVRFRARAADLADMHLWTAVTGAFAGAAAGGWLRAVVFRLSVPAGEPDRTACPGCGHALLGARWWLGVLAPTGRCPRCRGRAGAPAWVVELAAVAGTALAAGAVGPRPEALAFGFLALLGVALAAIDLAVHRLPDRLTLRAYPPLIALFAVAAVAAGTPGRLGTALAAGAVTALAYLTLVLIRPDQLGLGDVKLAGLLGIALGWFGWRAVLVGSTLAFVGCALAGLWLLATKRGKLTSAVPLGPFMVTGAVAVVLVVA
jgi:leader peptidase (prepilin peptidase) / N-methyltransferase